MLASVAAIMAVIAIIQEPFMSGYADKTEGDSKQASSILLAAGSKKERIAKVALDSISLRDQSYCNKIDYSQNSYQSKIF